MIETGKQGERGERLCLVWVGRDTEASILGLILTVRLHPPWWATHLLHTPIVRYMLEVPRHHPHPHYQILIYHHSKLNHSILQVPLNQGKEIRENFDD